MTLSVVLADEDSFVMIRDDELWSFRASALYGHPLANAFVVMVIVLFVLASDLTFRKKLLTWIFCMFGLLCFNERGNLLITILGSFVLFGNEFKNLAKREKRVFAVLLCVISGVSLYYMQTTDIGGRLFHSDSTLQSDSGARLAAFGVFEFLSSDELWWGSADLYDKMLVTMNLAGVENGYVAIILKYGLIFGIPAIVLFTIMQLRLLKSYSFVVKWIIFGAFNVIAFTNPHIATSRPWLIFIVAYYAFRPLPQYPNEMPLCQNYVILNSAAF